MLVCMGKHDDLYLIKDTDDNVTESVSKLDLFNYMRNGLVVSNLSDRLEITSTEYIDNAIKEWVTRSAKLTKRLEVLSGGNDKEVITGLSNLACTIGLIPKGEFLVIDYGNRNVIFTWQNQLYRYGSDEKVTEMDIMNPDVLILSRLGFEAFNYITYNLGTKKSPNIVKLKDCLTELTNVRANFTEKTIKYIGFTPSNRVFKISTGYLVYSVKFCTFADLQKKKSKILKLKSTDIYLERYIQYKKGNPDSIVVEKVSEKPYNIYKLMDKYPTLVDIYKC